MLHCPSLCLPFPKRRLNLCWGSYARSTRAASELMAAPPTASIRFCSIGQLAFHVAAGIIQYRSYSRASRRFPRFKLQGRCAGMSLVVARQPHEDFSLHRHNARHLKNSSAHSARKHLQHVHQTTDRQEVEPSVEP